MEYKITIKKKAEKYLSRLDNPTKLRIIRAIDNLRLNPKNQGEPLTNHEASFRMRIGSYRILYDVYEEIVTVDVVKIGPRGDVYN